MTSSDPLYSARLKIDRATKHIDEANELLRKKRPFRWVLKTNAHARQRAICVERDEAVINDVAIICGDAVHNLRAALDHAYVAAVSPFATTAGQLRQIQFPFSETPAGLEEAAKNRLAHKVSPEFFSAIMRLKPHGEPGGNELLYLIHALDIPDKHASLVPTYNEVTTTGEQLRDIAPDFPYPIDGNFTMRACLNDRNFEWRMLPLSMNGWIMLKMPRNGILKQEISIPVEIVFISSAPEISRVLVPTLHALADVTKNVVGMIEGLS